MGAVKTAILSASFASLALAQTRHMKRATLPFDGTIYTSCVTPGTIALTFDDGPYLYTQSIVDQLTAAGHRATFFQNGQNWDNIYNYNNTLKSMISGGHQIASHTWSHADLATLTADQITDQMAQLEAAHLAIIGKAPTYMRPPYLSTNDLAISTLKSLQYIIVEVNIDTQDWAEGPIGEIDLSIQWYEGNLTAGGSLSLNHDPYQPTADTFLPAIITYLASKGLKSVPAGECLGDDPANWYRGGSPSVSSSAGTQSATAAPSGSAPAGNGTVLHPSSTGKVGPGAGLPTGKPSYPTSGASPGKPVRGGDTEPGHGANAGRGAMPGHKGTGNNGYSGSTGSGSSGSGSGSSGSGGSGSSTGAGYGSGSGSGYSGNGTGTAGGAQPSYYVNGANVVTGSALALAIAAIALFL